MEVTDLDLDELPVTCIWLDLPHPGVENTPRAGGGARLDVRRLFILLCQQKQKGSPQKLRIFFDASENPSRFEHFLPNVVAYQIDVNMGLLRFRIPFLFLIVTLIFVHLRGCYLYASTKLGTGFLRTYE